MSKDISIDRPVPEHSTQFVGQGQTTTDELEVVLGVDFGTSSTRAVVQLPYYTQKPTFAVPLGSGIRDLEQYLLPTRLFIDAQGVCSLTCNQRASMFVELKTNLMEGYRHPVSAVRGPSCAHSVTVIATAYLALVLRQARIWFISKKEKSYGRFALAWMVNLGLPAAIDNDSRLRQNFDLVIRAAWIASVRPGNISISHCERSIADLKLEYDSDGTKTDIELVPEVIAQALGYAKSQFRTDGLHLLVDIGASTLDICSFNLFTKEHEYQWPILTADVRSLGARQFHYARLNAAEQADNRRILNQFDIANPLANIPEPVVYEKSIMDAQDSFARRCCSAIGSAIFDLKQRRYPNSPAWSGSLPVIICGGGSALRIYQRVIDDISRWMQSSYRSANNGLTVVRLPKPENLESNLQDDSFHRISVAYGLSYPTFDIGEYTRPNEIGDIGRVPGRSNDESSGLGARTLGAGDKETE